MDGKYINIRYSDGRVVRKAVATLGIVAGSLLVPVEASGNVLDTIVSIFRQRAPAETRGPVDTGARVVRDAAEVIRGARVQSYNRDVESLRELLRYYERKTGSQYNGWILKSIHTSEGVTSITYIKGLDKWGQHVMATTVHDTKDILTNQDKTVYMIPQEGGPNVVYVKSDAIRPTRNLRRTAGLGVPDLPVEQERTVSMRARMGAGR